MSILEKYAKALDTKDEAVMNEIIHDDYKFLMHASGKIIRSETGATNIPK